MKINKNVRENWRKYIILCLITLTLAECGVKVFHIRGSIPKVGSSILIIASLVMFIYTMLQFNEDNNN